MASGPVFASDSEDDPPAGNPGQPVFASDDDAPPGVEPAAESEVEEALAPPRPRRRGRRLRPTTGTVGVWLVHECPYKPASGSSAGAAFAAPAERRRVVGLAKLTWTYRQASDGGPREGGGGGGRRRKRTLPAWGAVDYDVLHMCRFVDEYILAPGQQAGDGFQGFDVASACGIGNCFHMVRLQSSWNAMACIALEMPSLWMTISWPSARSIRTIRFV
jgi:hypothetical protein